jgi:hypothetical protein
MSLVFPAEALLNLDPNDDADWLGAGTVDCR